MRLVGDVVLLRGQRSPNVLAEAREIVVFRLVPSTPGSVTSCYGSRRLDAQDSVTETLARPATAPPRPCAAPPTSGSTLGGAGLQKVCPIPDRRPALKDLQGLAVALSDLGEEVVLDPLVDGAQSALAHAAE